MTEALKLVWYVPHSHLDATKAAVFAAGAGQLGDYQHCCWQILGMGQFQPLPTAQPFLGQAGQLETVAEWRVEVILAPHVRSAVIAALREAHPYETPAFDLTPVYLD